MAPIVHLPSGACVNVELSGVGDVLESQTRVAAQLGVATPRVRLLEGIEELKDRLFGDSVLTAVVLPLEAPRWYPIGKYVHNRQHVLTIVKTLGLMRHGKDIPWTLYFVEGDAQRVEPEVGQLLVQQFDFRQCINYAYTNMGANEMAHTFVPREDVETPDVID